MNVWKTCGKKFTAKGCSEEEEARPAKEEMEENLKVKDLTKRSPKSDKWKRPRVSGKAAEEEVCDPFLQFDKGQ